MVATPADGPRRSRRPRPVSAKSAQSMWRAGYEAGHEAGFGDGWDAATLAIARDWFLRGAA
jgi:hypothetical protein